MTGNIGKIVTPSLRRWIVLCRVILGAALARLILALLQIGPQGLGKALLARRLLYGLWAVGRGVVFGVRGHGLDPVGGRSSWEPGQ